jgi:hypothetical protein
MPGRRSSPTVWNRAHVSASSVPPSARSVYRVRRGYFARALGRACVAAALTLLGATLCLALSAPGWLTTVLVVVTTIALVVTALAAVSMMLPPTLLQLDGLGFRAARRYSSGRRQASWDDVRGAASQQGPDGWVLIIQHGDGGHTAVPLSVADADPTRVEQDVRDRLNEAHGYRPLT